MGEVIQRAAYLLFAHILKVQNKDHTFPFCAKDKKRKWNLSLDDASDQMKQKMSKTHARSSVNKDILVEKKKATYWLLSKEGCELANSSCTQQGTIATQQSKMNSPPTSGSKNISCHLFQSKHSFTSQFCFRWNMFSSFTHLLFPL